MEAAASPIMLTDPAGRIEWVNPAFTATTGYDVEEAIGRTPGSLLGSGRHDAHFFRDLWRTILSGQVWRGRIVNRRKDGSLYPEEQTITPVRNPSGEITHFIAVKVDLSERERAWSRIRLQADLLGAVGQAMIGHDREGRITYWNRAAQEIFGWSASEAEGRGVLELTVAPKARRDAAGRFRRVARGERPTGELELGRRDGTTFSALVSHSPLLDEAGGVVGGICAASDLSDHKELEARVREAQKMEAVGRLARGVAHDFNNLLTVIHGHAHSVLEELPPRSALREEMDELLAEVRLASRLTRQLLAFSRHQALERKVVDLRGLVGGLGHTLRRIVPDRAELRFDLGEESAPVWADPSQLEQVILNLAVNAAHAVEGGGEVAFRIDFRDLTAEPSDATSEALPPGRYAALTVEDTGCGMHRGTLERAFEPFFTTKPEGRGTGLGLSTVRGIVEASGGRVLAASEPERGSRFEVLLPLAESRAATEAPSPEAVVAPSKGAANEGGQPAAVRRDGERLLGAGRTILLVEDSPPVRKVARRALERAGYRTIEAVDGREALEVASDPERTVDLVVSDLVMPGVGGAALLVELRRLRPGLPVVLTSGHTGAEITEEASEAAAAFLGKPFGPDELVRVVGETLSR